MCCRCPERQLDLCRGESSPSLFSKSLQTNLSILVRSSILALSEMDIPSKNSDDVFCLTNRKFVPSLKKKLRRLRLMTQFFFYCYNDEKSIAKHEQERNKKCKYIYIYIPARRYIYITHSVWKWKLAASEGRHDSALGVLLLYNIYALSKPFVGITVSRGL